MGANFFGEVTLELRSEAWLGGAGTVFQAMRTAFPGPVARRSKASIGVRKKSSKAGTERLMGEHG